MGNGIELHTNRMIAHSLHEQACLECCSFIKSRFTTFANVENEIMGIRVLRNKLDEILEEIDELEVGDGDGV